MVLSGSKKTSSLSSIVNKNSGGGPKKTGLPFQIGRTAAVSISLKNAGQNYQFTKGMKRYLKHVLMYYTKELTKITARRDAHIANVAAKISIANDLANVTVDDTKTNTDIAAMISALNVSGKETDVDAKKTLLDAVAEGTDNTTELAAYNTAVSDYTQAKTASDALNDIIVARANLAVKEADVSVATTAKNAAQSKYDNEV